MVFRKDRRITNSLWMAAEKLLQVAGVFIVTAAMARYIGPYFFGMISYFSSVFSLIYIASAFGADPIVIKKGSINFRRGLLRSVFLAISRSACFILLSLVFVIYFLCTEQLISFDKILFLIAVFLSQFLISVDYFSLVNNFTLNSRINTLSNVIGLTLALLLRYLFVKLSLPVIYFVIPIVLSPLLALFLKYLSSRKRFEFYFSDIQKFYEKRSLRAFLGTVKPFAINDLCANIYLKLPLLTVSFFYGFTSTGIYSCAVTIAGNWIFFPMALISSFIPKFYRLTSNEGENYLSKLFLLIFIVCAGCSLFIYFVADYVISYLYGSSFMPASELILPMVIASSLSALATVLYHQLIKMRAYHFIMQRTLLCALLSVPLIIGLTYFYGTSGAIYSLLWVELFSLFVCNLFFQKGCLLKNMLQAFTPRIWNGVLKLR